MLPDPYATLGIVPHSPPAAIRAAYVELMRRYHPDRNQSAAADTRVHAITLAYAVLSAPERRATYDAERRRLFAAQRLVLVPQQPRWRLTPLLAMFSAIAALVLLLPLVIAPPVVVPQKSEPMPTARPKEQAPIQPAWLRPLPPPQPAGLRPLPSINGSDVATQKRP